MGQSILVVIILDQCWVVLRLMQHFSFATPLHSNLHSPLPIPHSLFPTPSMLHSHDFISCIYVQNLPGDATG